MPGIPQAHPIDSHMFRQMFEHEGLYDMLQNILFEGWTSTLKYSTVHIIAQMLNSQLV